jgi:catechol 2,3-dioxygenase-like lactoylglutathione lyase family enzyme
MFSHVMVGSNDIQKSKTFYDATLGALGVEPADVDTERQRVFYRTPTGMFGVTRPINGGPASSANGATIGFSCKTPEEVEAWHAAGVAAGGVTCEDPPGLRELGPMKLYLAYLRDPDGNKLCALHFMS